MVAKTAPLPNIRKFFIPDPGYYIADADLTGADAQVVAWEAGDEDLKTAFRSGVNVHIKNARDVFPEKTKGLTDEAIKATNFPGGIYHDNKTAVHATNYVGAAKTVAASLGWLVKEAEEFQYKWFGLHPKILEWHNRIENQLTETRSVSNKFGYRIVLFDRVETLLPKALAWIAQSTVALTCIKGALSLDEIERIQLLLQLHDNLVFQYPFSARIKLDRKEMKKALEVTIPYDDPLIIPWSFKESKISWGDTVAIDW